MAGSHPPSWFYGQIHGGDSKSKCYVSIVDTVIFKGGLPSLWVFTGKGGAVLRRRSVQPDEIVRVFRRVGLEARNNVEKNVCIVRYTNGTHAVLNDEEFQELMRGLATGQPRIAALQAYVHPRGGDGTVYRNEYGAPPTQAEAPATATGRLPRFLAHGRDGNSDAPMTSGDGAVNAALNEGTAQVVQYLESLTRVRVNRATVQWVVEDGSNAAKLLWCEGLQSGGAASLVQGAEPAASPIAQPQGGLDFPSGPAAGGGGGRRPGSREQAHLVPLPQAPDESAPLNRTGGIKYTEGYLRGTVPGGRGRGGATPMGSTMGSIPPAVDSPAPGHRQHQWTMDKAREFEAAAAAAEEMEGMADQLRQMAGTTVGPGQSGHVLLVEADALCAVPVVRTLADDGFAVSVETDAQRALQLTRDEHTHFDVALVAAELPTLSGVEFTQVIRRREQTLEQPQRLAIVALSDDISNQTLQGFMRAGMDGTVRKPVEVEPLVRTVRLATQRGRGPPGRAAGGDAGRPAGTGPYAAEVVPGGPAAMDASLMRATARSQPGGRRGSGAQSGRRASGTAGKGGKLPGISGRDPRSIGPPIGPSQALPVSKTGPEDEVSGVFQFDAETAFPYTVVGQERPGAPVFHMIMCNDIFETYEKYQIFFRAICAKYPGLRVLVWNYPGQAFTEWRRDATLNNEYMSGCLHALLQHLGPGGTGEFTLDNGEAPFYLVGFGLGGAVASHFACQYHGAHPNLRALVLINGCTYLDPHLAGALHDIQGVVANTPASRPDLAPYFIGRFLFSPAYLQKVGAPIAINLYTAIHNPISLEGRIQLCSGFMSLQSTREALEDLSLPVIAVVSSQDAFVKPTHVQAVVQARGGEERSMRRALRNREKACVVWLRSGHEVWQEARRPMTYLFEQFATGYHERFDVAFLPLAPEQPKGSRAGASALAKRAMKGARSRARRMGDSASTAAGLSGPVALTGLQPGQAAGQAQLYEDRFLDTVVSSVHEARAEAQQMDAADKQTGDFPAALAVAPPPPEQGGRTRGGGLGPLASLEESKGGASMAGRRSTRRKGASSRRRKADESSLTTTLDPGSINFGRPTKGPGAKAAPEVREYMGWRQRRNRAQFQQITAAALQIQRCWRSYLARTLVERMRQQRGALTMQRWWRGCMGRSIAAMKRKEIWAVKMMQRLWRGYKGRALAWRIQLEEKASTTVQRVYRGWRARRFVNLLRHARRDAATKIQAMFRRRMAMRRAWELRDRHNASINVQRVWRGWLGRARARRERDKYLFSKSQSQGIEFGRQMLLEHKLHGTKLQSEVSLLTKEKLATEENIEAVLAEIATFEAGVRALEKEMVELARAEAEAAGTLDDDAKTELRESKMRLDKEFGEMLVKIADRREKLQALERKLQQIDRTRSSKKEELSDLERKLVVLLEEQQRELSAIKARQARTGTDVLEDAVQSVADQVRGGQAGGPALLTNGEAGSAAGGSMALVPSNQSAVASQLAPTGGPTPQQRAEANALLASTETMMKFGFMSMSMTYFASLNMVKAMRKVGAANTVLANPLEAGRGGGNPMLAMAGAMMGQAGGPGMGGGQGLHGVPGAALGTTGTTFAPGMRPGQTDPTQKFDVSLWTVGDVASWLDSLSLGQYKDAFADAAIDGGFLYDLDDDDLRGTLGIEHALHRKKILNSIRRLRQKQDESAAAAPLQLRPAPGGGGVGGGGGGGGMPSGLQQPSVASAAPSVRGGGDATPAAAGAGAPAGGDPADEVVEAGGLKLSDLMSWVRHNKGKRLSDALRPLPDGRFDVNLVQVPFVEQLGTAYKDSLNKLPFHINKANDHGNTLFLVAAQNGNMQLCKLLLKKGANPNHQNNQGNTALHYAMAYNFLELGEWLVDKSGGAGADDQLLNVYMQSPYEGLEPHGEAAGADNSYYGYGEDDGQQGGGGYGGYDAAAAGYEGGYDGAGYDGGGAY